MFDVKHLDVIRRNVFIVAFFTHFSAATLAQVRVSLQKLVVVARNYVLVHLLLPLFFTGPSSERWQQEAIGKLHGKLAAA